MLMDLSAPGLGKPRAEHPGLTCWSAYRLASGQSPPPLADHALATLAEKVMADMAWVGERARGSCGVGLGLEV
jgi:hypothetical protein